MGEYADLYINSMIDDTRWIRRPKKQRRRHPQLVKCKTCNNTKLEFLEDDEGLWYLGERDERGDLVRHVCKFKGKFGV